MDEGFYRQLLKVAKTASVAYYEYDDPVMLDSEYDGIMRTLESIEKDHPEWTDPESPTKVVGGKASDLFAKVEHPTKMLSLKNAYSEEDVTSFCLKAQEMKEADKYAQPDDPNCLFIVEPKLDGLTLVCKYDHGVFVQAVTRGDGYIGEDVTANALMLSGLPKFLPKPGQAVTLYCRGEVIMPRQVFTQLNKELVEAGGQPMANERNAAAGALRQSDPLVTRRRKLTITFYDMWAYDYQGKEILLDEVEKLRFMDENTLPTVSGDSIMVHCTARQKHIKDYPDWVVEDDRTRLHPSLYAEFDQRRPFNWERWEVNEAIAWFYRARHGLWFATDGAVIKVNNRFVQFAMGSTDKFPRWAIAFKFEQPQYDTILQRVTWSVGRTGKVTPVAEFDPVVIDGTEVKNATLNNPYYIKSLGGLREGDMIAVFKAAQIIPQVSCVVCKNQNALELDTPKFCPSCGAKLELDGPNVVCRNKECIGKITARIEWFVSKPCMDIRGLGKKIVHELCEKLHLQSPSDLYLLTPGTLMEHCGYTEATAKRLVDSITASKRQTFARVLAAIGIDGIGTSKAWAIARNYGSFDKFVTAVNAGSFKMTGIGSIGIQAIKESLLSEDMMLLIQNLRTHGLQFECVAAKVVKKEGKLAGKVFVITGKLRNVRQMYVELIVKNGGKVNESVTRHTSYLIAGEGGGTKRIMAQRHEVPIITEDQFMEMIKT